MAEDFQAYHRELQLRYRTLRLCELLAEVLAEYKANPMRVLETHVLMAELKRRLATASSSAFQLPPRSGDDLYYSL